MKYAMITNREKDPRGLCTEEAAGYLKKYGAQVVMLDTDCPVPSDVDIIMTGIVFPEELNGCVDKISRIDTVDIKGV